MHVALEDLATLRLDGGLLHPGQLQEVPLCPLQGLGIGADDPRLDPLGGRHLEIGPDVADVPHQVHDGLHGVALPGVKLPLLGLGPGAEHDGLLVTGQLLV